MSEAGFGPRSWIGFLSLKFTRIMVYNEGLPVPGAGAEIV